jgi:hypothetical protein
MKRKVKKEEKPGYSSLGMIRDIQSMKSYAMKFLQKGKEYDQLLSYLLKDDFCGEDSHMPDIKGITKELKLNYSKFKRLLNLIYEEIIADYDHIFEFNEVEYVLAFENYHNREKKIKTITVKSFPFLPRIGESVELPYFNEYLGTTCFFVEKIHHQMMDNKLCIFISLKGGFYNLYWHWRKDEAELKHELPVMDFFRLEDWELKKELGVTKPVRYESPENKGYFKKNQNFFG